MEEPRALAPEWLGNYSVRLNKLLAEQKFEIKGILEGAEVFAAWSRLAEYSSSVYAAPKMT